jgi:hypothetical protein
MTGATRTAESVRARSPERFGRSAIDRPALLFLPLGMAMGPHGLNVVPAPLLAFLDPAVAAALATLGALVGLGLYRDGRSGPALLNGVVVDVMLTIAAVGGGAAAIWRAAGLPIDTTVIAAACLGIAAATSAAGTRGAHPFAALAGRMHELGAAIAIVLGALALSWLRQRSPAASLLLTAELCGIAAMIGLAGWLLAGKTSDDNEQRVFAPGAVHLLGGAAEYLAVSALFLGLVAGSCWRLMGGAAGERLTRDLEYLQHPLVVLLLIIAGARCDFSAGAIALVAGYALCRTGAKLASGLVVSRLAASGRPLALGLSFLPSGVIGVAFALNVAAAWTDPAAAVILDVVVLGTLLSELLAIVNAPREAA